MFKITSPSITLKPARLLGALASLALVAVGCQSEYEANETLSSETRSALAALGIGSVAQDEGGYALFGLRDEPVGRVTFGEDQGYQVELNGRSATAAWTDLELAVTCGDFATTLVKRGDAWSSDDDALVPESACLDALEAGRLLFSELSPSVSTPNLDVQAPCETYSTWVWGRDNCLACTAAIPGGYGSSWTVSYSCSEGWASTSCVRTACRDNFAIEEQSY